MKETARINPKQAICFDVNQTLVRQGLSFEECFARVWGEYTGRWSGEDIPTAPQLWEQYILRWQQRKRVRTTFRELDELQQQCLTEALEALGVPASTGMTRSYMQELRQLQLDAKTVMPGTLQTLGALAESHRLAIISNSPRSEVAVMLERFGFSKYFPAEHIFTARRPIDKKPAPTLFRAALSSLGLTPRQAVMVGNSWKHDVCGAVKAGLDAVWLNPGATGAGQGREPHKIAEQRLGKRKVYLIGQLEQLTDLFP